MNVGKMLRIIVYIFLILSAVNVKCKVEEIHSRDLPMSFNQTKLSQDVCSYLFFDEVRLFHIFSSAFYFKPMRLNSYINLTISYISD